MCVGILVLFLFGREHTEELAKALRLRVYKTSVKENLNVEAGEFLVVSLIPIYWSEK